jgi:hypothetical protein
MSSYQFLTRWRVHGSCGEVADILNDPTTLPQWWPSVYLLVEQLEPPDSRGVGRRVRLRTKGWLPYTLAWELVVVESRYPNGFTIEATGDFVGRGVWTMTQRGEEVDVAYDWRIRVEKPLIKALSPVLRPVFEANHRWAMAQGEQSLKLELLRRRATSASSRAAVAPPPGPVTYAAVGLIAGAAFVGVTLAYLMGRASRRSRR